MMKKRIFALLYAIGATRLVAWWNRQQVMILCYHGVTGREERNPQDLCGLHVCQHRFAAQLDYLQRRYHVISLQEYLAARRERRRLPPYSIVLTFDDGFRNFLTVAAPHLAERAMPVTVFLITDRVRAAHGSGRDWSPSDDKEYLSWADVHALKREQEIEFGSHTCSHQALTTLDVEKAEREMRESHVQIVTRLKEESPSLAYPYGYYSNAVIERARALGYVCALTTDEGGNEPHTDLFALRRTLIGDDDDEPSYAARVSGLTCWLRKSAGYAGHRSGQRRVDARS
jgi:peptidoglycan/xylan/chitin deacetylase (PgdA/CDA1 family)